MVKRYDPEVIHTGGKSESCYLSVHEDDAGHYVEYSDYEKLEQENAELAKKATQRGARMQIMWELIEANAILTENEDENMRNWFDDDGVPL